MHITHHSKEPRFAVPRCVNLTLLFCSAAFHATLCHAADPPDVAEIVGQAATATRSDWAVAPEYAFLQRDESLQNGKLTSKTHRVVMIAGSDYYMPVAIDDQPLPPDRQESELRKLRDEAGRRNKEDPQVSRKRAESYRKQREQNGEIMLEFPTAFNFAFLREETINGHIGYVLAATPRDRQGPASRVAKILAGMRGQMWVGKDDFRMLRAEATVVSPVSIFGIFARVMPGTQMELEMTPVSDSVWLMSQLSMTLVVSKFLFVHSKQVTHSTFSDYRLNGPMLDELLSKATQ
jgi:hypothetical protein